MMKQLLHYMMLMFVGCEGSRYIEQPPPLRFKSASATTGSSEMASLGRVAAVVADV